LSDQRRDEGGFVLVWFALMLVMLLGMAAFSVDVGHWYQVRGREQRAADAAALAAAIHWPGDPVTARQEAIDAARRNGFDASEVLIEQGDGPARVKVTITRNVANYFGNFLGINNTTLARSAVGEFQSKIPLGSPANTFGDEPVVNGEGRWSNLYSGPADQPQFWGNVGGPRTLKEHGDAKQTKVCNAAVDPALCTSPDTNKDYDPNGYAYVVRAGTAPGGSKLAIEMFDPGFVNVGNTCTETSNFSPAVNSGETPNRYAGGLGPFCTGDQLFTGGGQDGRPTNTTVTIRGIDESPWDYLDNPVITQTSCDSRQRQFQGYDEKISTLVSGAHLPEPNLSRVNGTGSVLPNEHFRKWFRICEITTPPAGDYVVQIRSNAILGGDPTNNFAGNVGSGQNHFSIRAAFVNGSTVNSTGVSVFASEAMSIYANIQGADTEFYLARIFPGAAGRVLRLSFFDTGDAARAGNLTVLKPQEPGLGEYGSGSTFSGCTYDRPGMNQVGQATSPTTDCTIRNLINTTDNGDWIRMYVPIPADYSCNSGDPKGCWLKIKFVYPGGTSVHDVTTWAAELVGDPVRLVH
jgi:hypothetical protein